MHWSDVEEIAKKLEAEYAEEEIPEYNLVYLKDMIMWLPEFEDHTVEVQEDILKKILECWLEIRNDHHTSKID